GIHDARDGGFLRLSAEQSQQSLTVVLRDYAPNKGNNLPKPQAVLHGVSPVVSAGAAGMALSIRRIEPQRTAGGYRNGPRHGGSGAARHNADPRRPLSGQGGRPRRHLQDRSVGERRWANSRA